MAQDNKGENGLNEAEKEYRRRDRKLEQLEQLYKEAKLGSSKYDEQRAAIIWESHTKIIELAKNSTGLRFDAPEELRRFLLGLKGLIKCGVESLSKRAGEIYREAREYARLLREKNPLLPELPKVVENDHLMGWQTILEWCDDAEKKAPVAAGKHKTSIKKPSKIEKRAYELYNGGPKNGGLKQDTVEQTLKGEFLKEKFYPGKVSRLITGYEKKTGLIVKK